MCAGPEWTEGLAQSFLSADGPVCWRVNSQLMKKEEAQRVCCGPREVLRTVSLLMSKCELQSAPDRWVPLGNQWRRQLVKIKDCWKPFGPTNGTKNINGAWEEVTDYVESNWKETQLQAGHDGKRCEANRTLTANVPSPEHISTGSGPTWFSFPSPHVQEGC